MKVVISISVEKGGWSFDKEAIVKTITLEAENPETLLLSATGAVTALAPTLNDAISEKHARMQTEEESEDE